MSHADVTLGTPPSPGAPEGSRRGVASNTAWVTGSLLVSYGLTAITYALLARQVSPSTFGVELGFLGAATLLWALVDFGQVNWAVRELANSAVPERRFAELMASRVTIALSTAVLWVVCCAAAHLAFGTSATVVVYGVWIGLSLLWSALLVPDRAVENFRPSSLALVVEKLASLAVVVLVVLSGLGQPSLAVAMAVGAASGFAYTVARRRPPSLVPARPSLTIGHLRSSLPFASASIATQVQRLDVALVALFATPLQAGLYAAPARLAQPLQALPVAFAQATFARGAKADVMRRERSSFHRGLFLLLVVETLLVLPLLVAPRLVVTTVLGADYAEAADAARLIGIAVLAGAATLPLASALQASGMARFVGRAMLILAVFGLLPMAIGAYLDGATGAAAGSLLTSGVTTAVLALRWMHPERRFPGWNAGVSLLERTKTPGLGGMPTWVFPLGVAVLAASLIVSTVVPLYGVLTVALGLYAALCLSRPHSLCLVLLAAGALLVPMNALRIANLTPADACLLLAAPPALLSSTGLTRSNWNFRYLHALLLLLSGACLGTLVAFDGTNLVFFARFLAAAGLLYLTFALFPATLLEYRIIIFCYCTGAMISSLAAYFVNHDYYHRARGLTVHPNHLALIAVLALGPAVWWLVRRWSTRAALLLVPMIVVLLGAVYSSGSRAGAVGVATILVVVCACIPRARLPAVVVGLVAAVMITAFAYESSSPGSLLSSAVGRDTSTSTGESDQDRWGLLASSLDTLRAHPFTGDGLAAGILPHNIFIGALVAGGPLFLLGLLLVLSIPLSSIQPAIVRARDDRSVLRVGLSLGIVGFILAEFFQNSLWDRFFWLPMALLAVLSTKPRTPSTLRESPAAKRGSSSIFEVREEKST